MDLGGKDTRPQVDGVYVEGKLHQGGGTGGVEDRVSKPVGPRRGGRLLFGPSHFETRQELS